MRIMEWSNESEIQATEATYFLGFDLVVTGLEAGGFEADVVDDEVRWRGWYPTRDSARTAAEAAARRLSR